MNRIVSDILKTVIGLYVALVILYFLLRIGGRLPNGFGNFFQGASKLATPST
jgi:predicted PurR-regulated permease PerM